MSAVSRTAVPGAGAGLLPAPLYRVLSAPLVEEVDKAVGGRPGVLSALIGAHVSQSKIGVCWLRSGPHRHVNVLVGPSALSGQENDDGEASLIFPPGAVGRRLHSHEPSSLIDRIPIWVACSGSFDPLDEESTDGGQPLRGGSLEQCFRHLSHAAMAWLVVAEPMPAPLLGEIIEELAFRLPELRNRAESSEASRIALERDEAWYRELERTAPIGLWRVRALAGGATELDARRVATLLCTTTDVRALPYRLRPDGPAGSVSELLRQDGSGSFIAGHELLAAIARPPQEEIPGVRLVKPPPFDVTSEATGPLRLGQTLDEALRPCGRLSVSTGTLNRHAFVCGATGSGKSQTVRTLLESVARAGGFRGW